MTNVETRMSNEARSSNDETGAVGRGLIPDATFLLDLPFGAAPYLFSS